MNNVERIERLNLRSIWRHEAKDFTVWLQENIDVLKDEIGIELINVEREQSTGSFYVDLLAEDANGNSVIIENQLGKSDHDHLGKLITYLTAFNAKIAIWIVGEPKQEHINAISWLNETTSCNFYLLKIEAIRIGASSPAPLITKIVSPSEEMKEVGTTKKELSERHKKRYKYWESLLEIGKKKNTFNTISPTEYNWIGTSSGLSGVTYTFWVTVDSIRIDIYIDRGKNKDDGNIRIFNSIQKQKEKIENELGYGLEWLELPQYRACIVRAGIPDSVGWKDPEDSWTESHENAIKEMVNIERATKKIINNIKIKG